MEWYHEQTNGDDIVALARRLCEVKLKTGLGLAVLELQSATNRNDRMAAWEKLKAMKEFERRIQALQTSQARPATSHA